MIYAYEDPAMDWDAYSADKEAATKECPVCEICGEPITGEMMYDIEGHYYCEDCMDDCRVWTYERMDYR